MLSHLKYIFFAIIFAVLFTVGITKAAWRDAPAGPPNYGLISPDTQADYKPMNLGSANQTKTGGVNLATSAGEKVGIGGVAVGTARLAVSGENSGDAIAAYSNSTNSAIYAEQQNSSGYGIYTSGGINYFGGNIGIGTTPSFSIGRGLHIAGIAGTPDAVIGLSETTSGLGNFELRSTARGTSGNRLEIGEGSDTFLTIRSDDDGGSTTLRGNVGIGTASPETLLNLPTSGVIRVGNGVVGRIDLNIDTSGAPIIGRLGAAKNGANEAELSFWTQTSAGAYAERVRIDGNGNVGIGTEAPSARLAIGDTGSPGDTIAAYANSANSVFYAEQASSTGYAIYASGGLNYFSGNVGIGTTVPRATFHVDGSTILGGNGVNVILGASQAFPKGSVAYEGNGDWSSGGAFWAGPMIYRSKRWPDAGGGSFPDNNYGELMLQGTSYGSSYNKGISFVTWDGTVADPAIRMRIKEDGNVGIGTATPGAKLHIQGAVSGLLFDGSTSVPEIKSAGSNVDLRLSAVGTGGWVALRANGADRLVADPSGTVTVGGTLNAGTLQQGGVAVCLSDTTNCPSAGVPTWTSITGKPTTVVGYDITDMGSQSVSYANSAGSANSVAWSNITDRPSGLDDGDDVGTNYVSGLSSGSDIVTITGTAFNGWSPTITVSEADTLDTVTNRGKITANDITASAFYVSSDARLKKNVETLSGALEKLARARGVYYDLASGQGARQIGVIAQELEQEFPELVKTDDNGYKAVAYDRLSAVLIEAVKELKSQNQALQSRLDLIEKK